MPRNAARHCRTPAPRPTIAGQAHPAELPLDAPPTWRVPRDGVRALARLLASIRDRERIAGRVERVVDGGRAAR